MPATFPLCWKAIFFRSDQHYMVCLCLEIQTRLLMWYILLHVHEIGGHQHLFKGEETRGTALVVAVMAMPTMAAFLLASCKRWKSHKTKKDEGKHENISVERCWGTECSKDSLILSWAAVARSREEKGQFTDPDLLSAFTETDAFIREEGKGGPQTCI